jgi:hypothetical protein
MLNRKQKEELVTQLLEQGRNNKEIMHEVHVSPNFITSIRRKFEGDCESQPNIRNQAYTMYWEKGKKPIEVAIALNIDNVEAMRYWKEYLQLKRETALLRISKGLGEDFSLFVKYYHIMKRNNYWISDLRRALEIINKTDKEVIFLTELEDEKRI